MSSTEAIAVPGVETWKVITAGEVWVWFKDGRTDKYRKDRFGGANGSRTLRISIDDRMYNEEQILEENAHLNPFRNGSMVLEKTVGAPEGWVSDIDTRYHLSDDQLRDYLELKDGDIFSLAMEDITSEFVLRRILEVGGKDLTVEQSEILKGIINGRYMNSKTQKDLRDDPDFKDE